MAQPGWFPDPGGQAGVKGNIAGKNGGMRGNQQHIIEGQGFFDDFHVFDSDKIGIIREREFPSNPDSNNQCA